MRRVVRGIDNYLARGRRARALRIEKILTEKWQESQRTHPADPDVAWNEFVRQWEQEVLDRTESDRRADYPEIEELLALMAAKSPTFKTGLLDFLNNYGDIKYKVFAQFLEGDGKRPGTTGQRFWSLWQARIKLPMRRVWSVEDFSLFITETSDAMFRTMHPEPSMRSPFLSALGEIRLSDPETLKIWRNFSRKFQEKVRNNYFEFMESVTTESFGQPRPEVIRDFYRYGLKNTLYRRLTAYRILLLSRARGTALIEENSGLTIEDVDSVRRGLLYDRLPRGVRNAMVLSGNTEMYNDILLNAELEQLSFETMFFIKPLIAGLFLAGDAFGAVEGYHAVQAQRAEASRLQEIRQHPEQFLPHHPQSDNDMMQSLDDRIRHLIMTKRDLERELAAPGTEPARARVARRILNRASRQLQEAQELREDILRGISGGHH